MDAWYEKLSKPVTLNTILKPLVSFMLLCKEIGVLDANISNMLSTC